MTSFCAKLIIIKYDLYTGNEPYAKLYQLVTCGNDHSVKLWEVRVMQEKCDTRGTTASINLCRIMEKHSSALTCVRLSYNGIYTASCGLDKSTIIWETVRKDIFNYIEVKKIEK